MERGTTHTTNDGPPLTSYPHPPRTRDPNSSGSLNGDALTVMRSPTDHAKASRRKISSVPVYSRPSALEAKRQQHVARQPVPLRRSGSNEQHPAGHYRSSYVEGAAVSRNAVDGFEFAIRV